MNPQVIGLDLAVSASGVALPDGTTLTIRPTPRSLRGPARLTDLWRQLAEALQGLDPDLIVFEGPAPGSKGWMAAMTNAEWRGVARQRLWRATQAQQVVVPPSGLKRFATGFGRAEKSAMIAAARELGWTGSGHDEADAFLLRAVGLAWLVGDGTAERIHVADLAVDT